MWLNWSVKSRAESGKSQGKVREFYFFNCVATLIMILLSDMDQIKNSNCVNLIAFCLKAFCKILLHKYNVQKKITMVINTSRCIDINGGEW